ncbi:MAG: DUF1684 domain-containing protein [Ferruginibacter sp.]
MKYLLSLIFILSFAGANAQTSYIESLHQYQQDYIKNHEVVKGEDKKFFRFFPGSKKYSVTASFAKTNDPKGFVMKTSGAKTSKFYRYGLISFTIDKKSYHLTVYQSQDLQTNPQYKNYLFIPFTDLTSGNESYGGGKYIDITTEDIKDNKVLIDFNKAYNPYCAYATGYNCPIPPRENNLAVAIKAGEMNFGKAH